jgi:hypothetical protein
MRKNVASQTVGAQMVSASDGSAFTGATTVYVTGDGGLQAVGSVGGGACTHEGNGYHSYAPAQAETNYDHVAFTFIGSGAIPATVQIYTSFPQTGDAYSRLGAPAGASVSADILAIDNLVDDLESRLGTPSDLGSGATVAANLIDIEGQTDDIGVAGAGLTAIPAATIADAVWNAATGSYGAAGTYGLLIETDLDATISSRLATAGYTAPDNASISAILADTGTDGVVVAAASKTGYALADATSDAVIADAVWNAATVTYGAAGTYGEKVEALDTGAVTVSAIGAGAITAAAIATDAIDADALAADAATEIADALLKRDMSAVSGESSRSPLNALRAIRNKWSIAAGTLTVTKEDDATAAWTSALTTDAAANPITASDPA